MAVNFHHHIDDLIRDFQRRGMNPEIVQSSGNPPRAMEIRVAKKISVHWDADSRSVWAEGPWPEIERLESSIRRRFNGRWRKRRRLPKKIVGLVVVSAIVTLLLGFLVPSVRNHLASPFGVEAPNTTTTNNSPESEDGTSADNKKADTKPIETAASP